MVTHVSVGRNYHEHQQTQESCLLVMMVSVRLIAYNSAVKMDATDGRDAFLTSDSDTAAEPTPTSLFEPSV